MKKSRENFEKVSDAKFLMFKEWLAVDGVTLHSQKQLNDLFEWAFLNVWTRCLGHLQFPCEMSMCPALDLANHMNMEEQIEIDLIPETFEKRLGKLE